MPPTGPSEHQFRENSRAPVAAPVRLQFDAREEAQEGFTANLSIGGMFVQAKQPRPVGTLLRFELDLGTGDPITGVGEIVWIRAHSLGVEAPSGFGIQFGQLDEASRDMLKVVVLETLESLGVEGLSEPAPAKRIQRSSRPSPPVSRAEPVAPQRRKRSAKARPETRAAKKSSGSATRPAKKGKKGEETSKFEMSGRTKFLLVILGLLVLMFLFMT